MLCEAGDYTRILLSRAAAWVRTTSLIASIVLLAFSASAAIVVDSVSTTVSSCQNDGTATVHAHSSPDPFLLYKIVSGPTLMGLADFAAYAVLIAHIRPVAMAVTNSLNIAFLRACRLAPIVADARLLKLGRRLSTVDVRLWQDREARLVAQATVNYVLP